MQLRGYQEEAKNAVWNHLQTRTDNPCVVIPTGGGKSPLMAAMTTDAIGWGKRVLLLASRKELIEQNRDKLIRFCPTIDVGVYSAGMGLKNTSNAVIVAGIQSVSKHAHKIGKRDLIIIDEAHEIRPTGEGQYGQLLADMKVIHPGTRLVGLTATPYRMKEGLICAPDHLLHHICYEIGVKELIADGHLCPLISKRGLNLDFSGCHIQRGEYVESEVNAVLLPVVDKAIEEILKLAVNRKSILIFCQGIDHAQLVQQGLIERTKTEVGLITGDMLPGARADVLKRFKDGAIRFVVNINVLTTGFDAPNIDCVVLLRPTASPGLYYQMVGRAFRPSHGKDNALILDFGGNVERHGPVDSIEVKKNKGRGEGEKGELMTKVCPQCALIQAVSYLKCPECGHEWPPRELKHEAVATAANILSEPETFTVTDVSYNHHRKRDAQDGDPSTLRVTYCVGVGEYVEEWVCIEHDGWARKNAIKWWNQRCREACPKTVSEAMKLADGGFLATPQEITAIKSKGFWKILSYVFGTLPECSADLLKVSDTDDCFDDVPF